MVQSATITWTNPAGGDWSTAANWANGTLPEPGDDVIINLSSTNVLVTYPRGNSTVRSIQCTGAFLLDGGSLTVSAGASQFTGPFTAGPGATLDVDGAGTSLVATGPVKVDGAELDASRGGQLSLPSLANYHEPTGCGSTTWTASGPASILNLPGVTTIAGGDCGTFRIQALGGGAVLLSNLVALADGNLSLYAEGTNSVVNLSALPGYQGNQFTLSVEAKAGGTVFVPLLTEASHVNLLLDGGGIIPISQIRTLAAANLAVSGGAVLSLPGVGSYAEPVGCGSLSWAASGQGSVLDLPALTNLTGGNCGTLNIQALAGGQLMLKSVAVLGDGNLAAYAEGTNSVVDLSGLLAYPGTNFTFSVEAKAGGQILLPGMTQANRLNLTLDAGGFISTEQIRSLTGVSLAVNGGSVLSFPNVGSYQQPPGCGSLGWIANGAGSVLDLPGLTNLTGGNCGTLNIQALGGAQVALTNLVALGDGNVAVYAEGTNSVVDLSGLPAYRGTNFTLSVEAKAGGTVLLPQFEEGSQMNITLDGSGFITTTQIRRLVGANLAANGGAALSFSSLGSYLEPPGCGSLSWIANGAGSVLDLPGLTNLTGGNCGTLNVQALGGAQVVLSNLVEVGDGNVSVDAEGAGSVADLSALPAYHGTNFTFSVTAKTGGKVLLPQMTELSRMNFALDSDGFISTTQIRTMSAVNLTASGGANLAFPGVGSYQEPTGCGSLVWVANGAGSLLNLPALTNLTGGDCGALNIQALGGGQLMLKSVAALGDGNLSAYAEGTNSLVDFSGLLTYPGTRFTFSVEAKAGGRVLLPGLTQATRLNLTLDAGGFISTEQMRSLTGVSLAVSGGSVLSFPNVGSYHEPSGCGSLTWVASGAGSVLNLPGLTNLTGGDCGALNIQALAGGQVLLSNVVQMAEGNLSAYAEGTNSVVDLSALPKYQGSTLTFSIEAKAGGSVLLSQMVEADHMNFTLDAGGFISTAQVRSMTGINLTANGGATLSFPGITSYQEPSGCGSVGWVANGAGSVLDLRALTSLTGGNCGTVNIQSIAGGEVMLSGLVNIVGGNVSVLADGTNSVSDLSTLAGYGGTNFTLSVEARNAGTVPLSRFSFVSAGTVQLIGQAGRSVGNIEVFAGARLLSAGDLDLNESATISSQPGGLIQLGGSILGNTRNADRYAPLGTCEFQNGAHQLEAMSQDLGNVPNGYLNNFAYGTMALDSGAQVYLVDNAINAAGGSPEGVYVNSLIVPAGATLNLNGLHLYVRLAQLAGTINGGTVSQTPDNGGVILPGPGIPATISTAGGLAAWTFFGRAGQSIAVAVNPSTSAVPPPPLNYAFVQLFDPLTNLLAQASNVVAQQTVAITGVTLPRDGTYTVLVRAPGDQSASTGNYQIAVWFLANRVVLLPLNQQVHGLLQTPYSADQWNFTAAAGQQVRLDLDSASAPGLAFNLTGPNGWSGFSNQVTSSDLLTLPASGAYTLTAFGLGGAYDIAYAFDVAQTAETNLTLGTTITGQFSGNGQAQLFAITVTNASPLLITLNNAGANNSTELYVKRGSPPTRAVFDFQSANPASPNQQILVPQAVPGTYYILVYGNAIPSPGSYSLQALPANLFLTSATPSSGAHNAPLTMTLSGAGYQAYAEVQLAGSNGTVFPANAVSVDSFTQITASFASNSLPAGAYSIVVSEGADRAVLTNALTIASAGVSQLETKLILPGSLGRHQVSTLYVEYANTGTMAMPAPLLVLQGTGPTPTIKPVITLDSSRIVQNFWSSVLPPGTGNKVYILASGAQAGVLNPGERVQVPVYYLGLQQPWDFTQNSVTMGIRYWTADNTNSIDWSERRDAFRPPTLDSNSWNVIFDGITQSLTNSGAYIQMLDNAAQYLSRLGERVTDVNQLWNFAIQQAIGFQALPVLDSAVDLSLPAPGIALEWDRHYSSPISARNTLGLLGRGWYIPWQMTLAAQNSGALVEIIGEGGSAHVYTLDSRNGSYFSEAGDNTTLTSLGGGIYQISDPNGNVTVFRADGRIGYVADLNGNRVTAQYDAAGHLTSLSHSSGSSFSLAYNSAGLLTKLSDSAGRSVSYDYDAASNLVGVTTDDSKITTYSYQNSSDPAQGQALSSVSRAGTTRSFTYDAFGRVASTFRGSNEEALQIGYSPAGPVSINDGQGTTLLYFDARGLLAKITDPLGNSTTAQYDDDLRLIQLVGPTGASREFSWCTCGSLASLTDELGHVMSWQHDSPFKRLTDYSDPRGNTTSYTYDSTGNLLASIFPDNSAEQFGPYAPSGLPQSYVNRRHQSVSQTYLPSGEVATRTFADGSSYAFGYDARGNLLAITNHAPSGADRVTTYSYSYASDGDRVRQVTYPNGRWIAMTYDSYGRQTQVSDASGNTNQYTYDSAGRLASVSDAGSHGRVAYLYNSTGRLQRVNKGNGTYSTYDYDVAGDLLNLVNYAADGRTNSLFSYTYDARGLRTGLATLDGSWTYEYDATGQLIHASFASSSPAIPDQDLQFAYDPSGNRTAIVVNGAATPYLANNLNEYTTVGTTTFQYDADGNLVSDGTNTYQYGPQNQLLSVSAPQGLVQYEYDPLGNRIATILNGQRLEYLIDLTGNTLAEYDGAGQVAAQNIFGLGLAERLSDGTANWYDFDGLGSVAGLTGTGPGYLDQYQYLPFGGLLSTSGNVANPFTFDGQDGVTSDTTGVLHTWARAYDGVTGRFNSIDPLRLNGGSPNDYSYAANNPVLLTDPSGQCFIIGGVNGGPNNFVGFSFGTSKGYSIGGSVGAGVGVTAGVGPGGIIGAGVNAGLASGGVGGYAGAGVGVSMGAHVGASLGYSQGSTYGFVVGWGWGGGCPPPSDITIVFPCDDCDDGGGDGDSGGDGGSDTATSHDPNELIGPSGYAVQNFVVTAGNLFSYEILFENQTNATAPAQQVQITDALSTNLDWTTFRLTQISFGDQIITPPANAQHFETNVAFSYEGVPFEVDIEVGLRPASGEVFANFVSIDPATSLPPAVNIGFLPPEDGTGRGMGHLSYSVRPKANLATGLQITNVALIQFDVNPIIATDQADPNDPSKGIDTNKLALVTIDITPPVSAVLPLPLVEAIPDFTVNWSGQDIGSGIVSYDIYANDNGSAWGLWLPSTTNTSAVFPGQNGHTYGFYSVARDGAGNVETPHASADATTTVNTSAGPELSISLASAPNSQGSEAILSFPVSPGYNYVVEYRDDWNPGTSWQPLPGAPHNAGTVTDIGLVKERYYRLQKSTQ